jgi:hypothetical protein
MDQKPKVNFVQELDMDSPCEVSEESSLGQDLSQVRTERCYKLMGEGKYKISDYK